MSLWNELDNYTKVPSCTCGVAETMAKILKQEKVHQFLMGLNDGPFSTIRSQILSLDPLTALYRVFNMVQKEKHHKRIMGTREPRYETAAAFAVTHHGKPYRERQQDQGERPVCGHCAKTGHEESSCYELIGYPPGWNTRGGKNNHGIGRGSRGGERFKSGKGRGMASTVGSGSAFTA